MKMTTDREIKINVRKMYGSVLGLGGGELYDGSSRRVVIIIISLH